MSRIAEASARAGRAVPDHTRVDWAKERKAAERLLSDTAPEQAAHPSEPAIASSRSLDSSEQTLPWWPPNFDLDAIDLSGDTNARDVRRPSTRTQAPHDERRIEFDDHTSHHHSQLHRESVASSAPARSATSVSPRETAASLNRGTGRAPARSAAHRIAVRWVVVAVGLIVLLAAAALLTYLLRNRQVAARQQNVRPPIAAERASVERTIDGNGVGRSKTRRIVTD